MKIIFFGTSEFAIPILQALIKKRTYEIKAVITSPDRPKGRKKILTPSPIKNFALRNNLLVLTPENLKDSFFISKIENLKPDLIIITAYGRIIPKEILEIPQYGCLNIHPSLLPKYRGPSPIQFAILEGEKETGVSIILMDEKIDHGPVVAISKLKNQISTMNFEELSKELAELGAKLLIRILPKYLKGEIKPKEQDHSKATYTRILRREDGRIDWNKKAEEIERMVRAFYPWPGTFTKLKTKNKKSKILKIIKASLIPNSYPLPANLRPGQVFLFNKKMAVKCQEDALVLEEVQPEGKRIMKGEEFLLGHKDVEFLISNF